MYHSSTLKLLGCLLGILLLSHARGTAQCEFLKSDIEDVRSNAMEVLRISDTLETFAIRTTNYRSARSNSRKAQIYAGEILAATYRISTRAAEARQRAERCGVEGAAQYLSGADRYAERAKTLADKAFGLAKKAYASRNLSTIQRYLNESVTTAREARKAAILVAQQASEAHFCCGGQEIVVAAGRG